MATPILECRHVSVAYSGRSGDVPAVVDFNLSLMPGESHGLVGESGCGKSTIALAIMRYLGRAGRVVSGEILFEGRDLLAMVGLVSGLRHYFDAPLENAGSMLSCPQQQARECAAFGRWMLHLRQFELAEAMLDAYGAVEGMAINA